MPALCPEHTVFYTDAEGRTINGKVKGFLSLPLKKAKGGIFSEKVWKDKLFNWVKDNAPESITANMKESVNEDKFYNTRVQYTDPKSKKKFVGDVVRKDGDEYKVNLGKDGRFEKYILAKEKDLKSKYWKNVYVKDTLKTWNCGKKVMV